MQQTFLDIVYKIFYETAQRDFKDVRLLLSEKFFSPSIKFEPTIEVKIPIPRRTKHGFSYSGYLFKNTPRDLISVWSFFLATVYHLAAHVAVSNYSMYNNWAKGKTPDLAWKIITFIEDDAVERYLLANNHDVWINLSKIKNDYFQHYKIKTKKSQFSLNLGSKRLDSIKQEMERANLRPFEKNTQNQQIEWASELYRKRLLVSEDSPFYLEQNTGSHSLMLKPNTLDISPSGKFATTIKKLNYLYLEEKDRIDHLKHQMRKELFGLNFDEIIFPREDIFQFFQLKEENKKILKKIREQIRNVLNNNEDPQNNMFGEIDMELAIQAIASNTQDYAEVFTKQEEQRIEEVWGILIDNSASMRLRFKQVKDFMLCLAEASDELTGPAGSWGLFSYDQKFSILKDHKGKYNQDCKARIGGLYSGGLSYTSDAILLAGRVMAKNPGDVRNLFVFTDDFPTGIWNEDLKLKAAIREVENMGVEVIGIGLSSGISKYFRDSCWGFTMRELVNQFIKVYSMKTTRNI